MKLALALWCAAALYAASDPAKILRPADRAVLRPGEVDIVATAPAGKLELDGRAIPAEQPFPDIWHASAKVAAGAHTLALIWEGGRKQIEFTASATEPATFRLHPPGAAIMACTQCHELSARGRFRFKNGACFECHEAKPLAAVHSHNMAQIDECGLCHNAHGSTVKSHLLYPKEQACKLCHN
jgi:predicted CXXCH cytochrome family protein